MSSDPSAHLNTRRSRPWGLLALNVILVLVLGVVSFAPNAIGQFQSGSKALSITTRSGAENEDVLWLLDTHSMKLVAVGWDRTGRKMVPLNQRDVSKDVETLRQSR